MPTLLTLKGSLLDHLDFTSFDTQSKPLNQYSGDLASCLFDDSPKGLPRDVHSFCRLLVIKPFEISQSDRFKFVNG